MEERFLFILLFRCSPTTVVLLRLWFSSMFQFWLVLFFSLNLHFLVLFLVSCDLFAFWVGDPFVSRFVISGTWTCWPYCWSSLFGLLETFHTFGHYVVTSAIGLVLSPNCDTILFIRGRSLNLCLSVLSICYYSLMVEKRTKCHSYACG